MLVGRERYSLSVGHDVVIGSHVAGGGHQLAQSSQLVQPAVHQEALLPGNAAATWHAGAIGGQSYHLSGFISSSAAACGSLCLRGHPTRRSHREERLVVATGLRRRQGPAPPLTHRLVTAARDGGELCMSAAALVQSEIKETICLVILQMTFITPDAGGTERAATAGATCQAVEQAGAAGRCHF